MKKYFLIQKKDTYSLVKSDDHDFILKLLIKLVMSKRLYAIVSDENEVSILINEDDDELKELLNNSNIYSVLCKESYHYKCIEVSTCQPMLTESGMLAEVTSFFAENKIPILLLSSYSTNYVFYPQEFTTQLIQIIEKNNDFELSIDV